MKGRPQTSNPAGIQGCERTWSGWLGSINQWLVTGQFGAQESRGPKGGSHLRWGTISETFNLTGPHVLLFAARVILGAHNWRGEESFYPKGWGTPGGGESPKVYICGGNIKAIFVAPLWDIPAGGSWGHIKSPQKFPIFRGEQFQEIRPLNAGEEKAQQFPQEIFGGAPQKKK